MKTLQELVDFFEAIPSESWTKGALSSWAAIGRDSAKEKPEQNCAFGHLNKHLTGHWNYGQPSSWDMVWSLDISPLQLVEENNYGTEDAKTNVLNFLKSRLKEVV